MTSQQNSTAIRSQTANDPPAVHGMLLVGTNRIFLSHLPMFHPPHNYQVLLAATLTAKETDPAAAYLEDRRKTGAKLYTWVPEPLSLPSLIAKGEGTPSTMYGVIFRGHFERGGTPLTSDRVRADVTRVFHFRRFVPGTDPAEHSKYILFGEPDDWYLAHWITRPPDYDQVLSVVLGNEFPLEILESNSILLGGRKNAVESRLVAGEHCPASVLLTSKLALKFMSRPTISPNDRSKLPHV